MEIYGLIKTLVMLVQTKTFINADPPKIQTFIEW